jgi:hypothetical protein
MGESCVVKVEKGAVGIKIGDGIWVCDSDDYVIQVIHKPFPELRAAIDEKPVPRIELAGVKSFGRFLLERGDAYAATSVDQADYDALSELAGHPLPIWTGAGTWKELVRAGGSIDAMGYVEKLDIIAVWRYTR